MIFLKKEDYKRFKVCEKKVWIFKKIENYFYAKNLQEEGSLFFNFVENENFFFNDKDNEEFNFSEENFFLENKEFIDPLTKKEQKILNENRSFYEGNLIGKLARNFFKTSSAFDFSDFSFKESILLTKKKLLCENKTDLLVEAAFSYDYCGTRCDFLRKTKNGWDLIETKSSTKFKKEFLYDLAYQCWILSKNKVKLDNIYLLLINKNFSKEKFFSFSDFFFLQDYFFTKNTKTPFKKLLFKNKVFNQVEADLLRVRDILLLADKKKITLFLRRSFCSLTDLETFCTHVTPFKKEETIFSLYRLTIKKKSELFNKYNFLFLREIDFYPNKKLFNYRTNRQIGVFQNQEKVIDFSKAKKLFDLLKKYYFPIYFYDFETINPAFPKWDFSSPYKQIPFQFSVHILKKHSEIPVNCHFIADGKEDPRVNFAFSFKKAITLFGEGTYVAYYSSFEKMILRETIYFLEKHHKTNHEVKKVIMVLKDVCEKTLDLIDFFKDFIFYHKKFNGSLSIKNVLPALDESFSYNDLKIKSGKECQNYYYFFLENLISLKEWNRTYKKWMISYCERDSLGMVIIFRKICSFLNKTMG